MAMEAQRNLIQAVTLDGVMTRPSRFDEHNTPVEPWIEAEIIDVALTVDHPRGWYFGAVRYMLRGQLEGRIRAEVRTFHDLWMEGWTSLEFRDERRRSTPKPRRKRGRK